MKDFNEIKNKLDNGDITKCPANVDRDALACLLKGESGLMVETPTYEFYEHLRDEYGVGVYGVDPMTTEGVRPGYAIRTVKVMGVAGFINYRGYLRYYDEAVDVLAYGGSEWNPMETKAKHGDYILAYSDRTKHFCINSPTESVWLREDTFERMATKALYEYRNGRVEAELYVARDFKMPKLLANGINIHLASQELCSFKDYGSDRAVYVHAETDEGDYLIPKDLWDLAINVAKNTTYRPSDITRLVFDHPVPRELKNFMLGKLSRGNFTYVIKSMTRNTVERRMIDDGTILVN